MLTEHSVVHVHVLENRIHPGCEVKLPYPED